MEQVDVLVVGGGPAGSTCARRLRACGLNVLVLDKAQFPRPKLCAGWVTPGVLRELGLDAEDYRRGRVLEPMTGFRVGRIGGPSLTVALAGTAGYAVRRVEFDEYLLRRCDARLQLGEPADTIRRDGRRWVVNERFSAGMLVAAGGHFCPVARLLGIAVDNRGPLIASEEIEFELTPPQQAQCPVDPQTPELYFCDDLLGYGWCIRKGSFLTVGLGRADRRRLPHHVADFCRFLKDQGRLAGELPGKLQGHVYLVYEQSARRLLDDAVVWIGDAAGLAYSRSGEGIGPAIESGLMAAEVILAAGGDYRRERLEPYRGRVEARFGPRETRPVAQSPSAAKRWAGRWLLGRRWFVRRVVLERWFLHAGQPPLDLG